MDYAVLREGSFQITRNKTSVVVEFMNVAYIFIIIFWYIFKYYLINLMYFRQLSNTWVHVYIYYTCVVLTAE